MSIQQSLTSNAYKLVDSASTPDQIKAVQSHITQSIQNGTLMPYEGIPLIQQLTQKLQQANTPAPTNAPPPVAQQVMAKAAQATAPQMPSQGIAQGTASHGIDHLQTNLPTEHMAQGGIVAFDEGGEVEHFANQGLVQDSLPEITQAEFDALPAIDKMHYMQGITPQQRTNANIGARMTYGAPFLGLKSAVDTISNASKDFFTPSQIKPNPASPATPVATPASQAPGTIRPASADAAGISSLASDLTGASKDNPLLSALREQGANDPTKANPADTGNAPPSADAVDTLLAKVGNAKAGTGPVTWNDVQANTSDWEALKKPIGTLEDYEKEYEKGVGENKGLTERGTRLSKMEQENTSAEEKSPWLALMKAGIGAMKGTSPFALANIGAGAEEGLNDYIKAQDKISAKKDKIYDAQTALADAVRQEQLAKFNYGDKSKQADEAHNNTVAMHKIADKQATDKLNKEGAFQASKANAEIASADSRANMSAGVQLAIAKQDNEMKKYVADLTKTENLSVRTATAYHQAASDANAEFTALLGTKGVDPMGMGAVKSIAEATTLHNQLLLKHQLANGLKPMLPPGASTEAPTTGTLGAPRANTNAAFSFGYGS